MQSSEVHAHFQCRHGRENDHRNVNNTRNALIRCDCTSPTLKLSDIKVTDAKRVAVDDGELAKMKGKLVVLNDGKDPLIRCLPYALQRRHYRYSIVAQQK